MVVWHVEVKDEEYSPFLFFDKTDKMNRSTIKLNVWAEIREKRHFDMFHRPEIKLRKLARYTAFSKMLVSLTDV